MNPALEKFTVSEIDAYLILSEEVIKIFYPFITRADRTLKLGEKKYALLVALTSEGQPTADNPTPGLKEIQMPSLRGCII
jgi:hypothetical protein